MFEWLCNIIAIPFQSPDNYFIAGGITAALVAATLVGMIVFFVRSGEELPDNMGEGIGGMIMFTAVCAIIWPVVAALVVLAVLCAAGYGIYKLGQIAIIQPYVNMRCEQKHKEFVKKYMKTEA